MLGLPWWDGWSCSWCGHGGPGGHCVLVVLTEWLELACVLLVLSGGTVRHGGGMGWE